MSSGGSGKGFGNLSSAMDVVEKGYAFYGNKRQYDLQKGFRRSNYLLNVQMARADLLSDFETLVRRKQQLREQSAFAIQEVAEQSLIASGKAASIAASGNAEGNSTALLYADFARQAMRREEILLRSQELQNQQIELQAEGARRRFLARERSSMGPILQSPNYFQLSVEFAKAVAKLVAGMSTPTEGGGLAGGYEGGAAAPKSGVDYPDFGPAPPEGEPFQLA